MRKTKIICTLGPATKDDEVLKQLMENGMDVARINFSHGSQAEHKVTMDRVKKMRKELGRPVGILLDTSGPEIRIGQLEGGRAELLPGDTFKLTTNDIMGNKERVSITYKNLVHDVKAGTRILIDDGLIEMLVTNVTETEITCKVENGGVISDRKGINVPNVNLSMPYISPKDRSDILFGIEQGVDFIAASFVRCADDVLQLRKIMAEQGCNDIKIISKIENRQGVDNIDEIIDASYGIMIARGDLGIEVPIEQIPGIQRQIIRKCVMKKKPVIVATQMLHTMIKNPRPTRAEVTDIANAIYSYTDALMLSGETASGKYPLEAVQTMAAIAEQAEKDRSALGDYEVPMNENCSQREFLAHAAIEATKTLGVAGIITDSLTGETVRHLAAFRGPNPILAICYKEKTQRWLNLSFGVIPVHQKEHAPAAYMFTAALRMLRQKGYIGSDDKIAYLSGSFGLGNPTGTTFLEINKVSQVFDKSYEFHLPNKD